MDGITIMLSTTNAFTQLSGAITNLMSLTGDMLDTVVANPVLAIPLAGSIVGVAIGVIRRLKRI